MEYGNFDALLMVLNERKDAEIKEQLASAQQEAKEIEAKIIEEGRQRLSQRKQRYEHQLREKKDQHLTRLNMKREQGENQYKQDLIEVELDLIRQYFEDLSLHTYGLFLETGLKKYGQGKELPILFVPSKYYAAIQEKYSTQYEVMADQTLFSGYRLEFANYDVNMDMEAFFQFHRERLTRRMMDLLFRGERDEN